MEDARLVQDFMGGDAQAFNSLVQRWQTPIHRFAYRYFSNSDDAKEITQRTFVKAYQKIDTLSDAQKFSSWIYRIANNLCLDELKRAGRKRSAPLEALKSAETQPMAAAPDVDLTKNEATVLLNKALIQIPTEQRVVIIMKEYENLTFVEIAEILDEPVNTVKSRMYYGLKALKKIFNQWNLTKEAFDYES